MLQPGPSVNLQNWYCSGAIPLAVVAVHVTDVPAVGGTVTLGVSDVTDSGTPDCRKFATVSAVLLSTRCSSASHAGLFWFPGVHAVLVPAGMPSGEPA